MSAIAECGPPCAVAAPVQIPGPAGPAGKNASTTTTAAVTISITPNVVIPVVDSSWMITNMLVMINDGDPAGHYGLYQVTANPVFPYTSFIGTLIAQDSVPPGTVVASGAVVTPGAINGNSAWSTTTSIFSVLAPPASNSFTVGNSQGFAVGQIIIVANSYEYAHFQITSIIGPTITGNYLNLIGDAPAGALFPSGATVSPSGNDGINAFTTTTANFVLPAAQANVTASVISSAMLAVGQYVMASDGTNTGNFKVAALPTTTSVQLTWLDNTGDSVTGTTILSGAKIVPVGVPGPANTAIYSDPSGGEASPPGGYVVTGVKTSFNIGPAGGYAISGGTLKSVGDSIEFEAWFEILVTGGNKTIVVNWAGTPIFTYGPATPGANTFLKIIGRIVLTSTGPNLENCLVESVFGTATTTAGTGVSADPTLANAISFLITQTNAGDSTVLFYFMSRLLPV